MFVEFEFSKLQYIDLYKNEVSINCSKISYRIFYDYFMTFIFLSPIKMGYISNRYNP